MQLDEKLGCLSGTHHEWLEFKRALFQGRPYVDRISIGLTARMIQVILVYGEYECVLRELDYLEGLISRSQTKAETQYKGSILHPFWHKHFTTAYHIAPNILSHWGLPFGEKESENLSGHGNSRYDEMIADIANTYGHDPNLWIPMLADNFVMNAFWTRATKEKMTGDWLIFAKYDGQNYYLDIATHREDDDQLYQKLRSGSELEFPFLFNGIPL